MKHVTRVSKLPVPALNLDDWFSWRSGFWARNEISGTVIWLINLIGFGYLLPTGQRKTINPL